ncbi:MAG TPA: hypothetical protein PKZ22_15475 [Accumulibacter sp.]|jgi:hypothetical protein|nr:hypothetical protein [Accumulibacter sp.]
MKNTGVGQGEKTERICRKSGHHNRRALRPRFAAGGECAGYGVHATARITKLKKTTVHLFVLANIETEARTMTNRREIPQFFTVATAAAFA